MIDRRCVGKNVVFVATMDFDRNPQRMQHIASRLARVNNVIYVESPFSLIGLIRNGRNEFSKVIRFIRGSRQRSASLVLWTPPPSLYPLDKLPWISKLYARIVARGLKNELQRLEWQEKPVIYAASPWSACIGGYLPHSVLVLDWYSPWIDHWAHILLGNPIWKPIVKGNYWLKEKLAKEALQRADLILCGARIYQKQADAWGFTTMLLPNGAEMSMWKDLPNSESSLPPEVTSVAGLRIGVICARIHDGIVDFDLIEKVAQLKPDWIWLLVGLPMGDVSRLQKLPNVHFLGYKPYQDLPRYVAGFHLCAVPYRLGTTTQSGIPVKLLEYLPSGKPIITYPTPEVRDDTNIGDYFYYASTPEEFIGAAEKAIRDDPVEVREQRKKIVRQYDWDTLTDSFSVELAKRLEDMQIATQ